MKKSEIDRIVCSLDCNRMKGSSRCLQKIKKERCLGEIITEEKKLPKKYMIIGEEKGGYSCCLVG